MLSDDGSPGIKTCRSRSAFRALKAETPVTERLGKRNVLRGQLTPKRVVHARFVLCWVTFGATKRLGNGNVKSGYPSRVPQKGSPRGAFRAWKATSLETYSLGK